jgi:hypothetical protein
MPRGPTDPVIDEVREVRHRISERVGHDPARLVACYMELRDSNFQSFRSNESRRARRAASRSGG